MRLMLLNVFIWLLIFGCRVQAELTQAQQGADVTLSCEVSDLPESSSVRWEREESPAPNITLFYNNTAYIILHNVNHRSQGKYRCTVRHQGKKDTFKTQTLEVSAYAEQKKYTLYRESINGSNLSLICKSKKSYKRIMWIRQLDQTKQVMIAAEKGKPLRVHGAIVPGKHSSTSYNGQDFIFHISPVKFNYSGIYRCLVNDNITYTTLTLHTLRVFTEPAVMIRNQSVVLTCEVSGVTERVILAWLKMKGNRAVLLKQEVLTQRNLTRRVSVTLNTVYTNGLLCQCAVFTENTLRALAPITLHHTQSLRKEPCSAKPNRTTTLPSQGNSVEKGSDTHTMVAVVLTLCSGCVVVLLGALMLMFYRRKSSTDADLGKAEKEKQEKVEEEETEELHYASVTIVKLDHGARGDFKSNKETQENSDSVIYSTVNIK